MDWRRLPPARRRCRGRLRRALPQCVRCACAHRAPVRGGCYRSRSELVANASRRPASVEVESADWFGNRLFLGFFQGFFEAFRQCVAFVLFILKRLREERITLRSLVSEDLVCVVELWPIRIRGIDVTDHTAEVEINRQNSSTAGTRYLTLAG